MLTVTLDPTVSYEVRTSEVGVGGGVDRSDAAYLTRTTGESPHVSESGGEVAVEVRDGFNNPVSGTNVTFRLVGADGGTASIPGDGSRSRLSASR